jgi:hypothetical protein
MRWLRAGQCCAEEDGCAASGLPVVRVSEVLGHASVAFTLQTCGHVQAEMRKSARDAMERLFVVCFKRNGADTGAETKIRLVHQAQSRNSRAGGTGIAPAPCSCGESGIAFFSV